MICRERLCYWLQDAPHTHGRMTIAAENHTSSRGDCVSSWNRVSQNIHAFELHSSSVRLSGDYPIGCLTQCDRLYAPTTALYQILEPSSLYPNMLRHVRPPARCSLFCSASSFTSSSYHQQLLCSDSLEGPLLQVQVPTHQQVQQAVHQQVLPSSVYS